MQEVVIATAVVACAVGSSPEIAVIAYQAFF